VFAWFNVDSPESLEEVLLAVPDEYKNEQIAQMLSQGLSDAVRGVLIETNYVDKDFRSVYYNFYAKKGDEIRRNCVRVHLFSDGPDFDVDAASLTVAPEENADVAGLDDALSESYLGFLILRPTGKWNVGRTVLRPDAVRDTSGAVITSVHKVHILGHRLYVNGFPWMMQHTDISVCAHVACWSIMRHYSERYAKYAELLLHDVTKAAQAYDPGGLIPSEGLHLGHAERIFYAAGTFPSIVARENPELGDDADAAFESQMLAYLESGFPLYASMPAATHAIAIIGVKWKEMSSDRITRTSIEDAYERVEWLIGSDDNHLPYVKVGLEAQISPTDYCAKTIEAFIVPLPDKVFYPALGVYELIAKAPQQLPELVFPPADNRVTRYYITTAAAFHRELRVNSASYDQRLIQAMSDVPMAQFVWVIEYATEEQWQHREVGVRVVLDATASPNDNEPFWLAFDRETALIWLEKKGPAQRMATLKLGAAKKPYQRIQSNLRSF
jgi:hypothetical protein